MQVAAKETERAEALDHRVYLHGVSWDDYERILAMRGEGSAVRVTYSRGVLELMGPSIKHEMLKKAIARLLEAFADEHQLELTGCGSWTVRERREESGAEPDECYVLGTEVKDAPDLVIEVVWTSGGIDKLAVYARLGAPEVWFWRDGTISVFVLEEQRYVQASRSRLLPDLDLELLASFVDRPSQAQAVREYREALRRTGTR